MAVYRFTDMDDLYNALLDYERDKDDVVQELKDEIIELQEIVDSNEILIEELREQVYSLEEELNKLEGDE